MPSDNPGLRVSKPASGPATLHDHAGSLMKHPYEAAASATRSHVKRAHSAMAIVSALLCLVAVLTLPSGTFAQTAPKAVPGTPGTAPHHNATLAPKTFTLANGLEVIVISDHRTPVVTHMIWYRVGSADETPGKSGLAHFLEHLMFKGTKNHPAGAFTKTVSRIGGNENAFTFYDYTGYYQRVTKDQLPRMMEFEADRMTGLVLTDDVVLPERDVVLEEFNQRIANSPDARLSQEMMAALYRNHPYGRPVIGWKPEIEKLNREDALEFYRRFYAPNNAVVVIAGDVDADQIKALAEQTYGKIAKQPQIAPKRIRPQEPPNDAARTVTLSDPRVAQPSMRRLYLVPSPATAKPGESEALEVLAHLLGTGSNSYLTQKLVTEQGLATSAGAWYQGNGLDSTQFGVAATPKPGTSLTQIEVALDDALSAFAKADINEANLERAKTQLIAAATYAQDNQATLARWYGASLTTGSSVNDVVAWPERIRAVSAAEVQAAAQRWLERKSSVTGYLIKDEAKPAASPAANPAALRQEKKS